MRDCLNCDGPLRRFIKDIEDYEYQVPWSSDLVICDGCGLVTHDPPITAEDVPTLYPDDYHAFGGGSEGRGLYWKLRRALAGFTLRKVLPRIPRGGSLLEVGCGNGSFLRLVSDARPDIKLHGVDIVDTGIEGIPNFTFHQGQLEAIEMPEGEMDVVYFNNLIEHVPDPVVFLRKCHTLLRPGGRVWGNTPDHLSLDRMLFGKYWAGYHYPRHTFLFSHENMGQVLEKAGLVDPEVRGSYAFWSLSLRNRLMDRPGPKRRGLGHAFITIGMLPIDLLINVFRCHGAMTFTAVKPR